MRVTRRTTHDRRHPAPPRARGPLLFVYGTLRPGAGTRMAAWLAARAEHLGPAHTPGRLYDLGAYPGFVDARLPGECVHGDLYRLRSTAAWRALDDYENGGATVGAADFVCVRRAVHPAGGGRVDACLYLYRGPLRGARRIASGDWLAASGGGIMSGVGK
ncbi:MAG TPA: gamma-glutamylcyclotransferase family protein [Gammaproteobacteria bacterium]